MEGVGGGGGGGLYRTPSTSTQRGSGGKGWVEWNSDSDSGRGTPNDIEAVVIE